MAFEATLRRIFVNHIVPHMDTRGAIVRFTIGGSLVILAFIAIAELVLSSLLGTVFWKDLVRGLSIGVLIAVPALALNGMVMHQNLILGRRFRKAYRLAARNAEALADKNEELELARLNYSQLANSDFLTGLANRRRFETALLSAHERHIATGERYGLLLLDLDQFKPVNDIHGHEAGDAILRHVAVRLRKLITDTPALAARLGGDEFAILIEHEPSHETLSTLAHTLHDMLHQSHAYKGTIIHVGASIAGGLSQPSDTLPLDRLTLIDEALMQAKRRAKGQVTLLETVQRLTG